MIFSAFHVDLDKLTNRFNWRRIKENIERVICLSVNDSCLDFILHSSSERSRVVLLLLQSEKPVVTWTSIGFPFPPMLSTTFDEWNEWNHLVLFSSFLLKIQEQKWKRFTLWTLKWIMTVKNSNEHLQWIFRHWTFSLVHVIISLLHQNWNTVRI